MIAQQPTKRNFAILKIYLIYLYTQLHHTYWSRFDQPVTRMFSSTIIRHYNRILNLERHFSYVRHYYHSIKTRLQYRKERIAKGKKGYFCH